MDRKVKDNHLDKPSHQRWLYKLADIGLVKAILIIWGLCILIILATLGIVKAVLSSLK